VNKPCQQECFFAAQGLTAQGRKNLALQSFFAGCLFFIGAQVCFAILLHCVRATATPSVKICYALPGTQGLPVFSAFARSCPADKKVYVLLCFFRFSRVCRRVTFRISCDDGEIVIAAKTPSHWEGCGWLCSGGEGFRHLAGEPRS
jgi:hypothetical protein